MFVFVFVYEARSRMLSWRGVGGAAERDTEEERVQVDAASRIARNGVYNVDCVDAPHVEYARITLRIYVYAYMRYTRGAIRAIVFSARRAASVLSYSQYRKQCDFTATSARAKCTPVALLLLLATTLQGRH